MKEIGPFSLTQKTGSFKQVTADHWHQSWQPTPTTFCGNFTCLYRLSNQDTTTGDTCLTFTVRRHLEGFGSGGEEGDFR